MSEEISLPEISDQKKEEMRQAIRNRRKGKEPEGDSPSPSSSGPSSELMRKLATHAIKSVVAPEPLQEEVGISPSPCLLVTGAAFLALGIAFYFGHKYWKSYGIEELNSDLS